MATYNGLPLYKLTIDSTDDVTGVEFISLVDSPAIEVNWVKFDDKQKRYKFNSEKRMISGPFLIPDLPIYRADASMGEYFVVFDKENIEKIIKKFNKQQRTLSINYQHLEDSQVNDAILIEQWIVNGKNDKSKELGFELPDGTWFGTVYFEDEKFWNEQIKTDIVKGFSIEGFLNMKMNKNNKQNKMKHNFKAEVKTADGVVLYTESDSFVEGVEVYTTDAEGNEIVAVDGEYTLEDGSIVTIAEGKVVTIVAAEQQAAETQLEITDADLAIIMQALQPMVDEWTARISTLEERIAALEGTQAEMSTKLSSIPGAGSKTDKKDVKPSVPAKMTLSEKIKIAQELAKKIKK